MPRYIYHTLSCRFSLVLSVHSQLAALLLLLLSHFSHVRLYMTPQTAAHQAPLSLEFSRQVLEWVAISFSKAHMHAKSLQSCPTLYDPTDSSPPGSSVPGILQARILEWVAISFSNPYMTTGKYADDTTLMTESEEELKSLLMKVKEESEKVGLKLNIQKN